ncbi:hypothetical protein IHI26_01545 [Candidatus Parvarchaeota archaeon]|nr:hypothetical protein [Candidatus Acidifodinimicrobium mancum]
MDIKDKFKLIGKGTKDFMYGLGLAAYHSAEDFEHNVHSEVNKVKDLGSKLSEEKKLGAEKESTLEKLLSEKGSSIIPSDKIIYDPQVTPDSIWVNPDTLKRIDADEGDSVLLLGRITIDKNNYYPLRGPFVIETHDDLGSIYVRMNSKNSIYGGVYTEIINPYYLSREFKGKIERYFKKSNISVSSGPGILPMSYATKLADSYDFPRPKDGTMVPMMTYSKKGEVNGIYQAEVTNLGNKFQVPTDIDLDDVYLLGVYLGLTDRFARRKML